MSKSPVIIFVDGVDGIGKSTLIDSFSELVKDAPGLKFRFVREPGGTPNAEEIRTLLKHPPERMLPSTEILLFAAARNELYQDVIENVGNYDVVIFDRSYISSLVYQGSNSEEDAKLAVSLNRQLIARLPSFYLILITAAESVLKDLKPATDPTDQLELNYGSKLVELDARYLTTIVSERQDHQFSYGVILRRPGKQQEMLYRFSLLVHEEIEKHVDPSISEKFYSYFNRLID